MNRYAPPKKFKCTIKATTALGTTASTVIDSTVNGKTVQESILTTAVEAARIAYVYCDDRTVRNALCHVSKNVQSYKLENP